MLEYDYILPADADIEEMSRLWNKLLHLDITGIEDRHLLSLYHYWDNFRKDLAIIETQLKLNARGIEHFPHAAECVANMRLFFGIDQMSNLPLESNLLERLKSGSNQSAVPHRIQSTTNTLKTLLQFDARINELQLMIDEEPILQRQRQIAENKLFRDETQRYINRIITKEFKPVSTDVIKPLKVELARLNVIDGNDLRIDAIESSLREINTIIESDRKTLIAMQLSKMIIVTNKDFEPLIQRSINNIESIVERLMNDKKLGSHRIPGTKTLKIIANTAAATTIIPALALYGITGKPYINTTTNSQDNVKAIYEASFSSSSPHRINTR